ncbi:aldehyde dehydrogenase family protein [Sphingobacterium sp. E70]|nr:aldehyde dehydrogenase family protein [Sphingobacterium sp. E70]
MPLQQRLDCIIAFGQLILANKQELAEILTKETGKPITQSLNEIVGAQNRIEHLRTNASKWLSEELITTTGATREKIVYEPLGLIANISAWNFPYNVGFNVFLYALVAGNAVLYKPSEFATGTGIQFEKYLYQAGIPKMYSNVLSEMPRLASNYWSYLWMAIFLQGHIRLVSILRPQ